MMQFKEITIEGAPYERGLSYGRQCREEVGVSIAVYGMLFKELKGLSQSDARTDIYAAGVLYNVMLTGKHPTETFARGRAGWIIRKCTALNPANRYQSAKELAAKL